ncbi:MAG: nitroreductase family protein [Caldilineaceae bacterium]
MGPIRPSSHGGWPSASACHRRRCTRGGVHEHGGDGRISGSHAPTPNGPWPLRCGVGRQNLLLAAHAHGLGACWMCAPLFVPDLVRTVLDLPPAWEPQALITGLSGRKQRT